MRLFRIAQRAGVIASCGFNASLSQISKYSVRKPFGHFLEDLHRFSTLLLILQLSTIRVEVGRFAYLERLVPSGFFLIRAIQPLEDIRFSAEIFEPFLNLNGGIGPA